MPSLNLETGPETGPALPAEEKLESEKIRPYDEQEDIVVLVDPKEEEHNRRENIENRASFHERLKGLPENVFKSIDFAYDLAKESHRPQRRDNGERYFEHLRRVSLVLMDECHVKDPDIIITSLLHDSVEDSAMFGNATLAYSKWQETTRFRLSRVFNPRVAEMVIALTKPKVDGIEIKDKKQALEVYLANLRSSPPEVILIKMADRLHNLRDLHTCSKEKQARKAHETRAVYFPLFQKVLSKFPTEGRYLLSEMQKELNKLGF